MKSRIRKILLILKAILIYFVIVIDRLTMSLFIGVNLPAFKIRENVIDETTSDDDIERIINLQQEHDSMYKLEYLPRSRKRVLIIVGLTIAAYISSLIDWWVLLSMFALLSLSFWILFFWERKRTNKNG